SAGGGLAGDGRRRRVDRRRCTALIRCRDIMPAVARIEHITDPADARLAEYVSLRDVELRMSVEAEHGLFLAEGEKVVRRAVESGYPVRSFLMAPRWIDGLADVLDQA